MQAFLLDLLENVLIINQITVMVAKEHTMNGRRKKKVCKRSTM